MLVQARGHRGHAREIMTCTIRGSRVCLVVDDVMFMGAARSCILIPVGVYLSVVLRCSYSLHLTPDNKFRLG